MYRVTCEGCASCRFAAIGEMEIECWAAIGKSKESFDCAQDKPARMPFATTLRINRRYEMRASANGECWGSTLRPYEGDTRRGPRDDGTHIGLFVAEGFDGVNAHGAAGGEVAGQERDGDEGAGG